MLCNCSDITTLMQEAQYKEKKQRIAYPALQLSSGRDSPVVPRSQVEAEKWILGNTRCSKGDADHTEGKERCLQPVKCWRVACREADRG